MDETSAAGDQSRLPLHGLLVVALEQAVAAPFATRQLADLGARVIKVERRGAGDFARGYDRSVLGQSSSFVWLNRGKESLELDVKEPGDRAVLPRCWTGPTCSCRTWRPGAAGAAGPGRGRAAASGIRALITCSVSGYGADGPYREQEGLRPADAVRDRADVDHRHPGRSRRRPASRWPTSRPACTPTAAF